MLLIPIDLKKEITEIKVRSDSEISAKHIAKGSDDIHSKLIVTHEKRNLKSRVSIKVVLLDEARFDFQGMLRVKKGAIGTDTYLKIDCLVIGEKAYAKAIPALEILESEVKAGHGATIGYIDQDQMHYLKSKGLSSKEATKLLIKAFMK